MSKSAINNPFLTELKDKNGESWYHQIILERKDKEIERLNNELKLYKDNHEHLNNLLEQKENIIKEVRKYIESCTWNNGIDDELQYSLHIPTLLKILKGEDKE